MGSESIRVESINWPSSLPHTQLCRHQESGAPVNIPHKLWIYISKEYRYFKVRGLHIWLAPAQGLELAHPVVFCEAPPPGHCHRPSQPHRPHPSPPSSLGSPGKRLPILSKLLGQSDRDCEHGTVHRLTQMTIWSLKLFSHLVHPYTLDRDTKIRPTWVLCCW